MLRQIAQFRKLKWEAERNQDDRKRDDAQKNIDVSYQLIESHRTEEREIRRKLEEPGNTK